LERQQLRDWIEQVEYGLFGLPRPDRVILLDIPVAWSQELIGTKAPRTYTDRQADLQEADTVYLERVRQAYLELARDDPAWTIIPVTDGDRLRSVDEIAADVLRTATTLLGC
jgi:dTMP kinase